MECKSLGGPQKGGSGRYGLWIGCSACKGVLAGEFFTISYHYLALGGTDSLSSAKEVPGVKSSG